ncbi:sorcin-like isoform X1 [Branchiostoma lanceolatum]|uniref:sorcin-like isoform X1 n=1 Tax=Branchiostoma lanceolatum TaxID=7740 RepID=UPI0034562010
MSEKMALHPMIVCLVCLLASGLSVEGFSNRNPAESKIESLLEKIEGLRSLAGERTDHGDNEVRGQVDPLAGSLSKTARQVQPQADPLYGYFSSVAGADGQVDARELQKCLTSSGISGTYQPFSLETSRIMISMLDRDYSGKMGFNEFKELWAALNQWKTTFMQHDRDRSGTVEPHELHAAITSWGYRLSPQTLNVIVKRYGDNGRIKFDDFVACAVRLRMLTDHFRRRDTSQTGVATFGYDDFIQVVMYS